MPDGKFIVVEGLDGSGGTTQAGLLKQYFQKQGQEAYVTKEPTDGPVGAILRLALAKRLVYRTNSSGNGALSDLTLALLFAADRMDHLYNDILPKLELGITVISDRYYLSSFAYQAEAAHFDWLRQINSKCRKPDLTIFLDVPVEICQKRMQRERWEVHIFEEFDALQRVRNNYLAAIETLRGEGEAIVSVDGTSSVQDVHRLVREASAGARRKRQTPQSQLSFG